MKSEIKISEADYEIMMVIWEFSPISTNEVVDKLDGKNDWSPKTIQTLLSRLVKKGALAVTKRSREFVYTPQIKKSDYVSGESENFLKKFYNGTLNSMVMNFLEEDKLTDDDIAELKRILDKRL